MQTFEQLLKYRNRWGNLKVENNDSKHIHLAFWIKSQRAQYKLYKKNEPSLMNQDRIKALESIGFFWMDIAKGDEKWDDMYQKLFLHKNKDGTNSSLRAWLHKQRRRYKFRENGEEQPLTPRQVSLLTNLYVEWEAETTKKERTGTETTTKARACLVPGTEYDEMGSRERATARNEHGDRKRNERDENSDSITSQARASLSTTDVVVAPNAVSSTTESPNTVVSKSPHTELSWFWKLTDPDFDSNKNSSDDDERVVDCDGHESDEDSSSDCDLVF
jgi:hypothetical protein